LGREKWNNFRIDRGKTPGAWDSPTSIPKRERKKKSFLSYKSKLKLTKKNCTPQHHKVAVVFYKRKGGLHQNRETKKHRGKGEKNERYIGQRDSRKQFTQPRQAKGRPEDVPEDKSLK